MQRAMLDEVLQTNDLFTVLAHLLINIFQMGIKRVNRRVDFLTLRALQISLHTLNSLPDYLPNIAFG
jgi:hypothetical protein